MNKKIISIIIVVAILVIAVAGFLFYKNGAKEVSNLDELPVYMYEEDENYTKYTEVSGIEFSYPSNYKSIGNSNQPTFTDPEILGASVGLVYESSQGLNIEKYMEASIAGIEKTLTTNTEIQKEYINLNGVKAGKISYEMSQRGTSMKLTQVVIIKDGNAYVLTIGCLPDDVEKMQETTEKIIKSFK
ncbi:MAG: DUF1795 domain-containing protein [Clostridia bacterium]|nr:DUF1795 domain-containing protein [Clostridia bacterium]